MRLNAVESEAIESLQRAYVRALDKRDFDAWVDTFDNSEEASYICTSSENADADLSIALMYDDCRKRILDRVTFIRDIWAGTYQDYHTRHFIQPLHCEALGDARYGVETNFAILFTPETGRTEVQVAGTYEDVVILGAQGARFQSKKVIYDTTVLPRYIVYPF